MLAFVQSDRYVIRKVLGGNLGAFRVLVDRYGGVVHGVAYARLRNVADAEDIAQETFIRFYQQLDQMARRKRIGPWLVRVARNVSVDLVRKRGRDSALAERQQGERVAVPNPAREELHRILYEQLDGLDAESREVLILYYFKRKRAREIAALLEITPDAAAKRVQRARDELGRRLTDLLGEELEEVKADALRGDRIMVAIVAAPVAWKASAAGAAAAATAAGVATGAGAAKLAAAITVVVALLVGGYVCYEQLSNASKTQDVTAQSTVTIKEPAQDESDKVTTAAAQVTSVVSEQDEAAKAVAPEEESTEPQVIPVFGTVTGIVSLENGTPAANVEVWVDNQPNFIFFQYMSKKNDRVEPIELLKLPTRTDSAGRYAITGFSLADTRNMPFQYYVYARKPGLFARAPIPVDLLLREVEQDLVLRPDAVVGGVVRGAEGKPVANARILVTKIEGQERSHFLGDVLSNQDGTFLFEHMPVARCRLSIDERGFLHYTSPWLSPGSRDNVLQLDSGTSVSGRVVNVETSLPAAGVRVSVSSDDNKRQFDRYAFTESDEDGLFKITGCAPGSYSLGVSKLPEEFPLALVEPLTVTVETQPVTGLELKLATGAVLRGQVVDDETNLPVAAGSPVGGGARTCKTTEGGSYVLPGLQSGELTVTVFSGTWGKDWAQRYEGKVTLAPGEVEKTFDIHLPKRQIYSGVVVNELGEPVPWPSVYCIGPGNTHATAPEFGDVAGQFRLIKSLKYQPAAVYLQAVSDDGYSPLVGPFESGRSHSGIELRIARSGRLEGEVVATEGRPVEGLVLAAVPDSAEAIIPMNPYRQPVDEPSDMVRSINRRLGSGGRFVYPKLRPGKYSLEIRPEGEERREPLATADVTVQAGRTTKARLMVDMSGFGAIEGYVLKGGKPAAGLEVGTGLRNTETGPDGYYRLNDLAPGVEIIMAGNRFGQMPGGTQRRQRADVVAGEVTRVDFELAGGGGAIEGYVTRNKEPLSRIDLLFSPMEPPREAGLTVTTDENGWYRIDNVPEADYEVVVSAPGGHKIEQIHLTSGQSTRIDFNFSIGAIQVAISGLREGEKARIMVFPAEAYLAEWTVEALDALGEQIVMDDEVTGNGPFTFEAIEEGDYLIAAVAVSADAEFDAQAVLGGRIAVSAAFSVAAGGTAEVALEIK
ncbi:MAG TPA: sigma-70 family RNA polymerase sigma factor [Candidatus Bathyarchaeia archaeon]|nr:sigma-70 family RNA polymerase sigma factor [Candidatus Bathyarchaeia archaeon]